MKGERLRTWAPHIWYGYKDCLLSRVRVYLWRQVSPAVVKQAFRVTDTVSDTVESKVWSLMEDKVRRIRDG